MGTFELFRAMSGLPPSKESVRGRDCLGPIRLDRGHALHTIVKTQKKMDATVRKKYP
jgi:hypothetical protein